MLQTRFAQQLTTNYPTQSTFLIAFSGGLDSTALLNLFANQAKICRELKLRAIHIHHGLSPNADYWAEHCQQICHQLHIPLIIERVQVCKEKGIEAGAREARYQAMARQLQTGEVLVTAHHQQDQTETFFLALKRGSGIKGLSAMQAKSAVFNLAVFRPLLEFTRQELQQYAEQSGLPWIEDESNGDNRYERNFLRNQVLPQLRERWKHIDQAVQRTAQHCFEQQQLLTELLQEDLQNCIQNDRTFALTAFPHFSSAKQKMLLRLWLEQWDIPMPSQKQLEQILSDVVLAQADKNPQFKLGQKYLRRYQQTLYLTEKFADLRTYRLPIQLGQQVELPDGLGELSLYKQEEQEEQGEQWIIEWQGKRSFLSPTTASIEIRFHYSGKVRQKNGLNEDIKKCWQRHLVPTWQRQRIPLIFYGEVFQCAVGLFANHPQLPKSP